MLYRGNWYKIMKVTNLHGGHVLHRELDRAQRLGHRTDQVPTKFWVDQYYKPFLQ